MKELITGITAQPDFPKTDLLDSNAMLLEFMIANVDLLLASHQAVETNSLLFRQGHPSIVSKADELYDHPDRINAVNYGVMSFEAINAIVSSGLCHDQTVGTQQVLWRIMEFMVLRGMELENRLDQAIETFRSAMPRTTEVVRAGSTRFHGHLSEYALLGAALSRQIEIDSCSSNIDAV